MHCSPDTPIEYLNRKIFAIGICVGLRPSEMVHMTKDQFKKENINVKIAYTSTEKDGCYAGSSKTNKSEFKAVSQKPVIIPIFDRPVLNESVYILEILEKYMCVREALGYFSDRFSQYVIRRPQSLKDFSRNKLKITIFRRRIKEVYVAEGVLGDGELDKISPHILHATMISLLLQAGHSDSAIAMRTATEISVA